ncbi:DNA-3-methyladenine glycosylase [Leptolyngbya sp. FACHB-36]|uniref:DNA-3-methyladenine glycosylase family protein n=1 Tax=Leptolyngbya sp. FACHB-36 TaxID=2692808 RepID=UPI001F54C88D|nr:DNA-3-methyladenine glycosylase [Leptolyngbya sp. FACHB-36]
MERTSIDYSMAIATLKQADSVLAALIDRVGPCTLDQDQQTGDLFDCLARAILYQQLSGKSAAAIHGRFLQLFEAAPQPLDILNTPDDVFRQVGISRPKILYLKDLASRMPDFPSLSELAQLDDEAIVQTLIPVKGIGRWTVQMLLIFRLHRWDVLPVDDLGVRSGIRRLYNLPDLPNKATVEQVGHAWKPFRTIASWYLWRSLDIKD